MKIARIKAKQPKPEGMPGDWRGSMGQIVVIVETTDGCIGYGVGGGGAAGVHVIEAAFQSLLVGADANDVEGLWEYSYAASLAYGRKGLAIMALSGVDLALWDLRGREANQSIRQLLAVDVEGPANVPAYATCSVDAVADVLNQGYTAIKISGVGQYDPESDAKILVELLTGVRQMVGDHVTLMIDAAMQWRRPGAVLDLCKQLLAVNLAWIEMPLPADDLRGYTWLVKRSPIPIAGGEHEFTARGFHELMERRCHHIYQPDINWCGGLTQLVEIYRLAAVEEVRVCPHRGGEIWGLHPIMALDPVPLAESGRPWMQWVGGNKLVCGLMQLADDSAPGFGIELPM